MHPDKHHAQRLAIRRTLETIASRHVPAGTAALASLEELQGIVKETDPAAHALAQIAFGALALIDNGA